MLLRNSSNVKEALVCKGLYGTKGSMNTSLEVVDGLQMEIEARIWMRYSAKSMGREEWGN